MNKSALKKLPAHHHTKSSECGSSHDTETKENRSTNCEMQSDGQPSCSPVAARRASWDPLMPTPRKAPRPPLPFEAESVIGSRPAIPARTRIEGKCLLTSNTSSGVGVAKNNNNDSLPAVKSPVEIVSVFAHADKNGNISSSGSNKNSSNIVSVGPKLPTATTTMDVKTSLRYSQNNGSSSGGHVVPADRFNTHSSSGSSSIAKDTISLTELSSIDCAKTTVDSLCYQVIVYYIGSVELPEIEERKRLQALSACVRRLRVEKKVRKKFLHFGVRLG